MTPRPDLGRLGVVSVVVFSVSSIRRSAVFNVEHLRLRLRAGQREGERRGKDWAWFKMAIFPMEAGTRG